MFTMYISQGSSVHGVDIFTRAVFTGNGRMGHFSMPVRGKRKTMLENVGTARAKCTVVQLPLGTSFLKVLAGLINSR